MSTALGKLLLLTGPVQVYVTPRVPLVGAIIGRKGIYLVPVPFLVIRLPR